MGLLDLLSGTGSSQNGGLLDLLGGLFGPSQANAQTMPPQQQPQQPQFVTPMAQGLGGRITGAIGGFFGGGSPVGGLLNAAKTLTTGELTDPQDIARAQMLGAYHTLQKDFGMSEPQARIAVNNPLIMKELAGAMVKPTLTVGPDGSILQQSPFGGGRVLGGFPVSERAPDVVNSDGSKSPGGYNVKPSLSNPTGYVVQPGQGIPRPSAPTGASPAMAPPSPADPTMTVSPRQVITEMSPQAVNEQTMRGKGLGEDYTAIQKDSATATKTIPTLQRMRTLNLDPNLPQGVLAPAFQTARSVLISLGVPAKEIKAGEEFNALHNRLTIDANNGSLGTGFSNADRDYLDAINPATNNSKAGREALIEAGIKVQQRKQEVAKLADKYVNDRTLGNGSLNGFQTYLAQWSNEHPLFPAPPPTTFGDRFGAASGGSGSNPTATNPKTGQTLTFRDGKWQ